jgi:hypothetical protein
MNGLPQSPRTQDPTLRALVERGLTRAQAREAAAVTFEPAPAREETATARPIPPPRTLRLDSDRACVETNLARKGLWRSGSAQGASGGELVRLLDANDQLGLVQRIDAGPALGALAFDVIVWACSRWRERGEVEERHVPFTLEAMAQDLGWRKGGGPPPTSHGRSTPCALRPSGHASTTPVWARRASTPSASSTAGSAASATSPAVRRGLALSWSATGFTSSSPGAT